ncbi:hypothetical protein HDV57DRAFT_491019 [Trichoderma longibrachiatum]
MLQSTPRWSRPCKHSNVSPSLSHAAAASALRNSQKGQPPCRSGGSSLAPSPPCFGGGEPPRCALSEGGRRTRRDAGAVSMALLVVRCPSMYVNGHDHAYAEDFFAASDQHRLESSRHAQFSISLTGARVSRWKPNALTTPFFPLSLPPIGGHHPRASSILDLLDRLRDAYKQVSTQGLTQNHPASLHMYSHTFGVRSCCAIGPIVGPDWIRLGSCQPLLSRRSRRAQCYLYALASADSPSPRVNVRLIDCLSACPQ